MAELACSSDATPRFCDSSMFRELSAATIRSIFALSTRVRFEAGEVLFFQDDPGDALFMVELGRVEISIMSLNGKKLALNIMKGNDVFGEIAVLDGGSRTATATALKHSTLLRVGRKDVLRLMRDDPEVAVELVATLCARLRWVSRQVEDFGLLGIQKRLANRLTVLHGRISDDQGELHICQNDLADFLGATRESVNKVLQVWRREGIVDLSRGTLRILDRGRLSEIVCESD